MASLSPTSFSDSELQASYWFVSHRLILYRIAVAALIALAIVLWGYCIWQLIFFARAYPYEQQQLSGLLTSQNGVLASVEARQPQPLNFGTTQAFGSSARIDTLTTISNPNNDWVARFKYVWGQNGQLLTPRTGFVLPGETKYLMGLALPAGSQLQITDTKWERIRNFAATRDSRLKFRLVEQHVVQPVLPTDPTTIAFSVANDSAFSYWEAGLQILMYSGPNVIAIDYITADQFKAGTTRTFQIPMDRRLSQSPTLDIIPDIDILNQDNIMAPESIDVAPIEVPTRR